MRGVCNGCYVALACLLAFCLSILASEDVYAPGGTSTLVPPNDPSISYQGRVDVSNWSESVQFDWSGVSISISFSQTDLIGVLLLDNGNYYDIYLDGELIANPLVTQPSVEQTYNLTTVDASQSHVLTLYKRTEALFGIVSFYGFVLTSYGEGVIPRALPAPQIQKRTIEFLGDSLTCAYGNLGTPPCNFAANTENVDKGFVTLAAALLNVDSYHIECWSGKGVVRNYGYNETTSPDPFPIYFNRTVANNPSSIWNFTTYNPSAVVVTLGGNDYSTQPVPSFDQFYAGYAALLDTIFRVYDPNVLQQVFCACGPLPDDPCAFVQQVVTQYNNSMVSFISLANTLSAPTDYGCDGHPSTEGDIKVSKVLAEAIFDVLGWDL